MHINHSTRARGGNRGGTGGGYEHTDPDWERHRLRRLRAEHDALDARWQAEYLRGLSRADKWAVEHREEN